MRRWEEAVWYSDEVVWYSEEVVWYSDEVGGGGMVQ